MLSLLYGPTLTSIHDYWRNYNFYFKHFCWQNDLCFLINEKYINTPPNQYLCDPQIPSQGPLAGQGAAVDTLNTTPYVHSLVGETALDIVWKDHNTLGRSEWAKVVI